VFHFHQGSTPWRLQELLPLDQTRGEIRDRLP
jgi:hypothetical protein